MAEDNSRFVVDFGSTQLPKESMARINRSIQKTVLLELADLDFSKDAVFRFPREWYGIWIEIPGEIVFNPPR